MKLLQNIIAHIATSRIFDIQLFTESIRASWQNHFVPSHLEKAKQILKQPTVFSAWVVSEGIHAIWTQMFVFSLNVGNFRCDLGDGICRRSTFWSMNSQFPLLSLTSQCLLTTMLELCSTNTKFQSSTCQRYRWVRMYKMSFKRNRKKPSHYNGQYTTRTIKTLHSLLYAVSH